MVASVTPTGTDSNNARYRCCTRARSSSADLSAATSVIAAGRVTRRLVVADGPRAGQSAAATDPAEGGDQDGGRQVRDRQRLGRLEADRPADVHDLGSGGDADDRARVVGGKNRVHDENEAG